MSITTEITRDFITTELARDFQLGPAVPSALAWVQLRLAHRAADACREAGVWLQLARTEADRLHWQAALDTARADFEQANAAYYMAWIIPAVAALMPRGGAPARFHLTHVGPYAGQPICGGERTASDQHPSYSQEGLARQLANCCDECALLWNEAGADECAECGHGHWSELTLTYSACPVDECGCEGQS